MRDEAISPFTRPLRLGAVLQQTSGPTATGLKTRGTTRTRSAIPVLSLALILLTAATARSAPEQIPNLTIFGNRELRFGTVECRWSPAPSEQLRQQCETAVKDRCSGRVEQRRLEDAIAAVLEALAESGYRHGSVIPRDFRLNDDRLDFALEISTGPPVRIALWELSGLMRTDSLWLARSLGLPTGTVASRDQMDRALRSVRRLSGIEPFGSPEVLLEPGDTTAVIRLHLRESPAVAFEGSLTAQELSARSGSTGPLTGRTNLRLSGLFRRDRTVDLRYDRFRPSERLFQLRMSESMAFHGRLDWSVALEDWRRADHRQTVGLSTRHALSRRHDVHLHAAGEWKKITPGTSRTVPARVWEGKLGLGQGTTDDHHLLPTVVTTGWSLAAGVSRRQEWDAADPEGRISSRLLTETRFVHAHPVGRYWLTRLRGAARWWANGRSSLGAGDEWFLGGAEILRGYEERAIAAADGLWGSIELIWQSGRGLGIGVLGDAAHLKTMVETGSDLDNPISYGVLVHLEGEARRGRLEFAWRDGAAWRDGIVRLSVAQGW